MQRVYSIDLIIDHEFVVIGIRSRPCSEAVGQLVSAAGSWSWWLEDDASGDLRHWPLARGRGDPGQVSVLGAKSSV